MRSRLASVFGFARRRAFDAAGGGRRWEGAKGIEALNASFLAGAATAGPTRQAAAISTPGCKARNERRALAVSKFKSIGRRIWPA